MSDHHAAVRWTRETADFAYESYNRAHVLVFKDGGIVVDASAAPAFRGDAARVDPEEAFVGSLASCHMLSFLAICARKRLAVDSYADDAVGRLELGPNGKFWIGHVTLRPQARFTPGTAVSRELLADLHHRAHEECFIANSVKTAVAVEPVA